ncbi:5168_t:CDS:1, partial [Entrophospora sp. SA101]
TQNKNENDESIKNLTWILFEASLLQSRSNLEVPSTLVNKIYNLIELGLLDIDNDGGVHNVTKIYGRS